MSHEAEQYLMLNGIAAELSDIHSDTGVPMDLLLEKGSPTPSGWPAAVTVRPDNWNMNLQPATYRIAAGDTLAGLAATYLGAPNRVMEIWSLQPAQFRFSRNMDEIFPGDIFLMPDEARDNLKSWIAAGKPTEKKPGQLSPTDKTAATVRKYLPYVAGGAAGLFVLYLVSR